MHCCITCNSPPGIGKTVVCQIKNATAQVTLCRYLLRMPINAVIVVNRSKIVTFYFPAKICRFTTIFMICCNSQQKSTQCDLGFRLATFRYCNPYWHIERGNKNINFEFCSGNGCHATLKYGCPACAWSTFFKRLPFWIQLPHLQVSYMDGKRKDCTL